jgi:hypothetical protein
MHTESTNPTVARPVRTRRGAVVAVTALACAALIGACGSSSPKATTNLDTHRVALSIEQSIFTKRHLHSTVTCPEKVPQEQGKTFVCIAATRSAKKPFGIVKNPFTVTIQNNRGYVTYVGQ